MANPSIRFTARNACDPPRTMATETSIVAGNGFQWEATGTAIAVLLTIDPATDRGFLAYGTHTNGATTWAYYYADRQPQ